MKTYKILLAATLIGTGLVSCDSFLEEYSQDLAKVESWQDLDELLLGNGYLQTSNYSSGLINRNIDCIHFMSDEMKQTDVKYGDDADRMGYITKMFPYYTWQQELGYDQNMKWVGGDNSYWDFLYEHINIANQIIVEVDNQSEAGADDRAGKARVKGEAQFLRAVYYYFLVNLYGKPYSEANASLPAVPVKTTEYIQDIEYKKATVQEVYDQILSDLDEAEENLKDNSKATVYRASYAAVLLFKARIYLYMQNWSKAAEYAQKTIDARGDLQDLHLVKEGTDCISGSSKETIFTMGGYLISIAFADLRNISWYVYADPSWFISDDMMEKFTDENDLRASLYIGKSQYFDAYPILTKVDGQTRSLGNTHTVSDCFTLRTPEAYLIKAEANAYLGKDAEAQNALQQLRNKRLQSYAKITETGDNLIELIRDENAREFLLEGHRWFDLRRYTVCKGHEYSKTITHKHTVYNSGKISAQYLYRLEQNDNAYTLPVPRSVSKFQVSLGFNDRPDRTPVNE